MFSEGIVSSLAGQLVQAKARASHARAGGKDARATQGVVRSLRLTLCSYAQKWHPRSMATIGFDLVVSPTGEVIVRHRERLLPVSETSVKRLFREAGVELQPGQVLVLDTGVVQVLVEEALGVLFRAGGGLNHQTGRLVAAGRAIEALEKAEEPKVKRSPSGAA